MKLDKILGKLATILEVIAIFILIFKAKSMIVTTANWFEFMAIFTGLLIDLLYNKIKWKEVEKMKFYTEITSKGIEYLFKLLDEKKAEILQDKNASDSQKAINEYFYRNILNQINNILIDTTSKNEELIKD